MYLFLLLTLIQVTIICYNAKETKWKEHKMLEQFQRTEMLIGKEGIEKLQEAKVAIFGIGGVGSYVLEALARVGIRKFYFSR